jgi:gliding motility-associated-like protein
MRRQSLNWSFLLIALLLLGLNAVLQPGYGVVEICDNGIDDNNNGLIDCYDPQCSCVEPCLTAHYFYPCEDECQIRPDCENFSATLKWESNVNVGSYPIIVAGDIDRDGIPEVITYELESNRLIIISGSDGVAERFITTPGILKGGMGPAIADLTNDGYGEIVIVTEDRDLVAYRYDGTTLFHSPGVVGYDAGYAYAVVGIADFNQDGTPEIYIGNQIFDNQGMLIVEGGASNSQGVHPERAGDFAFSASVAIDAIPSNDCIDCQGLELVAGNQIYTVDIDNSTMRVYNQIANYSDGYTSVADLDGNGTLDAIVQGMINGEKVAYGWELTSGNLIGEFRFTGDYENGASRINIGDINGDGRLEMAFSCHPFFYALDNGFNELWRLPIFDHSSVTASTIFDFCGDGKANILYRDEVNLFVIDGETGSVVWSIRCESSTHFENPIVIDIDGDGETDICFVCGNTFSRGRVYAYSPSNAGSWAETRKVWNQHGYFNVNINDDLSVPSIQQNPHIVHDSLVLNGFMNQYASYDFRAVDLEMNSPQILCRNDSLQISFSICNIGGIPTNTAYNGWVLNKPVQDASAVDILQSKTINSPIQPDSCINTSWKIPISGLIGDSVFFAINANQTRLGDPSRSIYPFSRVKECDYTNNTKGENVAAWLPQNFLSADFVEICENNRLTLTSSDNRPYNWFFEDSLFCTGCISIDILPNSSGWIYVSSNQVCGRDSLEVNILPEVSRSANVLLCEGDSILFGSEYLKTPGSYQRVASSQTACDTLISLTLEFNQPDSLMITAHICPNESYNFKGTLYDPGLYELMIPGAMGCDSFVRLEILENTTPAVEWSARPVCGDRGAVQLAVEPLDSVLAIEVGPYMYLSDDEIWADTGAQLLRVIYHNGCERQYQIDIEPMPEVVASTYPESCMGNEDGVIRATPPGVVSHIRWQGVAYNGPSITEVPSGRYQIEVVDTFGCITATEVLVSPGSMPIADIQDLFVVPYGQPTPLPLYTSGINPLQIRWDPTDDLSCDNCDQPVFTGTEDRDYTIMVMDSAGCMTEQRTRVEIDFQKKVFIPNAFSPNDDGINDIFSPEMGPGVKEVVFLQIYSRWGDLIYSMDGSGDGWDGTTRGKLCQPGVYIYKCRIKFVDNQYGNYSGDVTLIR